LYYVNGAADADATYFVLKKKHTIVVDFFTNVTNVKKQTIYKQHLFLLLFMIIRKTASKVDAKQSILREINLNKSVLFGAFGSNITNSDKESEWKKIHRMCQSLSICNATKDWKYTRDVIWANFRRRTLVGINKHNLVRMPINIYLNNSGIFFIGKGRQC
jgi:hypothetical protein